MNSPDPDDELASDDDRREIWSAVGVLSAAEQVGLRAAHRSLCDCAVVLDVARADVAAYVLWNGSLPV